MEILQLIASLLIGSGGIIGVASAIRAWRAKRAGVPENEAEARLTPNWDALTDYYRQELEKVRASLAEAMDVQRKDMREELDGVRKQVTHLTRLRSIDANYIDALEAHIWQGKPPPPPIRPQYPSDPAGEQT